MIDLVEVDEYINILQNEKKMKIIPNESEQVNEFGKLNKNKKKYMNIFRSIKIN